MRIRHLRVRDLKRHAELDLHPAAGVTVIRGPNEAGKSTIQRALEMALFRRVTAGGQEMEATRRWGASGDADPVVEMEFEVDGSIGRLRKVFGGARGTVDFELGAERLSDPAAVDARLAELTGLPSEKFFRSTASVRHQELADLERDGGTLRDRLQMSMSGADRGTHAAKRKLDDAIRRYRAEGVKNPGPLKSVRDEIAALESRVRTDEAELTRLQRDREALSRARDQKQSVDRQLQADEESLAASERAVALLRRQQECQTQYERYRRAAALRDDIGGLEAAHPSSIPLAQLRPAVERLRALANTISELRAELATEPDLSGYDVAIPAPRWRPWAALAVVLLVAALVLTFGGVATGLGEVARLAALALAGVAVVMLGVVFRQLRLAQDVRRQNLLRDDEISRRLRGRSERAHELQSTEEERDRELVDVGLPDVGSAESLLAQEMEHVAAIERLRAEYRGLLGDEQPTDDVANLRDQMAAEAEQLRHALSGMGQIGAEPERNRERFGSAVTTTRTLREKAVGAEADASARVEHNPVDAEEVAARVERLAALSERLRFLDRRSRIYEKTLASLNAAEQATMKKAARFLEQHMGADVEQITAGRYRDVRVDETELSFSVWSPEREDWVDVRHLSQGTLDQFYLAARLGLVRQVTEDRRPPLVFDDPFVTFDDERARGALELLKRIAADHQVIYLTCSDRYDAVADTVIVLPGPSARDSRSESPAEVSEEVSAAVGGDDPLADSGGDGAEWPSPAGAPEVV
ncbi:AAA family ATPase [soil metagenome]